MSVPVKKLLVSAATSAALVAGAAPAQALTWVSQLEYRDGVNGAQTPFGTVTINEIDANNVQVTVTLANAASKFINTGGPHDPFLFNLTDTAGSTGVINAPIDTFQWGGPTGGPFSATPFGDFTNLIKCCNAKNGEKAGETPPLVFTVSNAAGLSFAGANYSLDINGFLTGFGTGNRFAYNSNQYLFSADIYDGVSGSTYNVAAMNVKCTSKDCVPTITGGVPEPATWAMTIIGFAGVGSLIRRRRAGALAI